MSLRRQIKRSIALTCLYYMADDRLARYRLARGRLATRSGTRHATLSLDESLGYIERVYRDYLAYGGIKGFSGCVAEIGPGDNFGVALRMLGAGAGNVHTIDRYRPVRDNVREALIYRALAERHGFGRLLTDAGDGRVGIGGLTVHAGAAAETFFRSSGLRFDYIVSRAVLEHLYDPLAALDDMAAALTPGGTLIHRIDFRDHGMFAGHHPLTFLIIPDALYRAMTRGSGRPNRLLLPAWRDWLERSPLAGSLLITRLAGVEGELEPAAWDDIDPAARRSALETVHAIRPRLTPSLAAYSDQDLAVSGCVLVARRPASETGTPAPERADTRPGSTPSERRRPARDASAHGAGSDSFDIHARTRLTMNNDANRTVPKRDAWNPAKLFGGKASEDYKYFANDFHPHCLIQWTSIYLQCAPIARREDVHSILEFGSGRNLTKFITEYLGLSHTAVDVSERFRPDHVSSILDSPMKSRNSIWFVRSSASNTIHWNSWIA